MKNINYRKITGFLVLVLSFCVFSNNAFALTLSPVRFELSGDPGQTVHAEMTLMNENQVDEIKYYSSYANFEAQGETGNPNFIDPKEGLGTWINVQKNVILLPGESKKIPIDITIPFGADPGGNFAAIFWSTTPPDPNAQQVTIGAKTGVLVLLSVNGEVKQGGAILDYGTKNNQRFYTALPVSFSYRFQNTGNDRVKPVGTIDMRNFIGIKAASIPANKVDGNVLPKSIRKFEPAWQKGTQAGDAEVTESRNFFDEVAYEWKNFAFGYFTAHLNLEFGTDKKVAHAKTGFWVIPWQLLIVIIILALIAWFIVKTLLHRYNHWIINQAQTNIEHELGIDKNSKKVSKKVGDM